MTANEVIQALKLEPLEPEGGYFRQTYQAAATVETPKGGRPIATCIYYLVTPDSFSKFHSLKSTEIYHYYMGDPLTLVLLHADGTAQKIVLGSDLAAGQVPQAIVPAGVWQGSFLEQPAAGFSLVGATCFPGFEPADFTLGTREEMLAKFPMHQTMMQTLMEALI